MTKIVMRTNSNSNSSSNREGPEVVADNNNVVSNMKVVPVKVASAKVRTDKNKCNKR